MKKSLLEYIVCPVCSNSLSLKEESVEKGEIMNGMLICDNAHKFVVSDGIARLVPKNSVDGNQTVHAFSQKWVRFGSATSSSKWVKFQYKWYLDRFWHGDENKFKKFMHSQRHVLDAGTGMGHSAKWFSSSNPKAQIFAIDISKGIDIAYKNYGNSKNIHFIQADLTKLPFRKSMFDFISSDQVLHHTADTERSFKYLTGFLNKNGVISIYVYKKKAPIREFSDDYIRSKVTDMKPEEAVKFSKAITLLARNLAKLNAKLTVPEDIPLLEIKKGKYDLQRFIYYHMLKCFWSDNSDYKVSLAVNFDWYYPKYAFRHTVEEINRWFEEQNLKIMRKNVIPSGISIMGKMRTG